MVCQSEPVVPEVITQAGYLNGLIEEAPAVINLNMGAAATCEVGFFKNTSEWNNMIPKDWCLQLCHEV